MLSVDTNIVVRLLVNDDPEQAARARQLFESNEIWIGVTVLLEAAWVLGSAYGLTTAAAGDALRRLAGLPNVYVEDASAVATALEATQGGLELADALHVVRGPEDAEFATFDRRLARAAKTLRPVRLA